VNGNIDDATPSVQPCGPLNLLIQLPCETTECLLDSLTFVGICLSILQYHEFQFAAGPTGESRVLLYYRELIVKFVLCL